MSPFILDLGNIRIGCRINFIGKKVQSSSYDLESSLNQTVNPSMPMADYLKNQKIDTGGKIDIPQELLNNAKDAEKEQQPT